MSKTIRIIPTAPKKGKGGGKNRKYGRNKRKKSAYGPLKYAANKKRALVRQYKRSKGLDKQTAKMLEDRFNVTLSSLGKV